MIIYHRLGLLNSCLNEEKGLIHFCWCFWEMEIIARAQFYHLCLFIYETLIFFSAIMCGDFYAHVSLVLI
jgi:hypothetical protein